MMVGWAAPMLPRDSRRRPETYPAAALSALCCTALSLFTHCGTDAHVNHYFHHWNEVKRQARLVPWVAGAPSYLCGSYEVHAMPGAGVRRASRESMPANQLACLKSASQYRH